MANNNLSKGEANVIPNGVKYCRTCYNHLAGFVGVKIVEALETKGYITKSEKMYLVSDKGWEWLLFFSITKANFTNNRRPLTRQCLDWSERRPHLAGQLGDLLLEKMFERKWFKKVNFSRELVLTAIGRKELFDLLAIVL